MQKLKLKLSDHELATLRNFTEEFVNTQQQAAEKDLLATLLYCNLKEAETQLNKHLILHAYRQTHNIRLTCAQATALILAMSIYVNTPDWNGEEASGGVKPYWVSLFISTINILHPQVTQQYRCAHHQKQLPTWKSNQ